MKTLAKGLSALLICGSFIVCNCEDAQAAEVADLSTNSVETQELAGRYPPPPPPPPPRGGFGRGPGHGYGPPGPPHHDDWREPPHGHRPPPPPPPGHRPPPGRW